mmetsp:Transcript_6738/g.5878  ORF Transcript_6738/g.5878 Transcript_6738/m.5878 type:complete len:112 (-) Transcript_6738:777-1112(-)
MRLKINCFDVLLFTAISYAISDLILSWDNYKTCKYPMNIWLSVSYSLTISIRLMHYIGHILSESDQLNLNPDIVNIQDQARLNFNWRYSKLLKTISFITVIVLFPMFIFWT